MWLASNLLVVVLSVIILVTLVRAGASLVSDRRRAKQSQVRGAGTLRNWVGYSCGVTEVPPGWYFCHVEPIAGDEPYVLPRWRDGQELHRLDVGRLVSRGPSRNGRACQAVVTGEELQALAEAGFLVTHHQGPRATEGEAERDLVDFWKND